LITRRQRSVYEKSFQDLLQSNQTQVDDFYTMPGTFETHRLHSGYHHPVLRDWQSANTNITPSHLMYPVFLSDDPDGFEDIPSLPKQHRYITLFLRKETRFVQQSTRRYIGLCNHRLGVNRLESFLHPLVAKGLKAVLLFGVIGSHKKVCRFSPILAWRVLAA
jgi:porphobilinogen synthase